MLYWAWQNHAADSGLHDVQHKWWDRWTMKYKPNKRVRSPSIQELARTLAIAENYQKLADVEYEPSAGLLGALWAVILTAQRTGPLMRTRRDRLFDHDKLANWKIANWTANEMKGGRDGGRPHSLPIPTKALSVFEKYRDKADKDSEWLFPSVKSGPITQPALNRLLYRLQGYDADQVVKQTGPASQGRSRDHESRSQICLPSTALSNGRPMTCAKALQRFSMTYGWEARPQQFWHIKLQTIKCRIAN